MSALSILIVNLQKRTLTRRLQGLPHAQAGELGWYMLIVGWHVQIKAKAPLIIKWIWLYKLDYTN